MCLGARQREEGKSAAQTCFWIAACGLLALPLFAEVFWRIPKRSDTVLEQMGGTRVYETAVRLNGAPGTLTAYAFEAAPAQTAPDLARRLGLPVTTPAGGSLLLHAEKGRLVLLLVLPAASGNDATLILAFSQTLRDAARVRQEPPEWPEDMPALNATPVFSAICEKTRSTFVTAETAASPESAVEEAAQALAGAGWTEAVPSGSTFKLFAEGRRQCVLFASSSPQTGSTTISLLQRMGSTP